MKMMAAFKLGMWLVAVCPCLPITFELNGAVNCFYEQIGAGEHVHVKWSVKAHGVRIDMSVRIFDPCHQ